MRNLTSLLVLLTMPIIVCAEAAAPIQSEITKLDTLASNPQLKLVVVAAMADSLGIHRNHLLLQRRDTGQSFASIFVSELRAKGMTDDGILRSLREVLLEVDRQLKSTAVAVGSGARPVLFFASNADHSSVATVYSLVPEIGFDSSHVAALIGVPFFRLSDSNLSSSGIGDVYASAFLRGRTGGFDIGSTLTLGAPSGDRSKGLGAGKVTVDAAGTVARRFEFVKPWISGGFANSVFNNVGYQRPYITDGNAAHFAGGMDFALPHRLSLGIAGFGLEPIGNQVVYSQPVATGSSGNQSDTQPGNGMMPGAGMSGMGPANTPNPPNPSMPFYGHGQQSTVPPGELRDYGASLSFSIRLNAGVSLNTSVAQSIPFSLTTAHIGIAVDVAHFLFPNKRF
jgi:hypothetical protein